MAWELRGQDVSFRASEAIEQYRFVVLDSTENYVRKPNNAAEYAIGITQNAASASGDVVNVRISGFSKVVANAALAVNAIVMPEYVSPTDAGKADDATGSLQYAKGQIVAAASAEDDLATVLILSSNPA